MFNYQQYLPDFFDEPYVKLQFIKSIREYFGVSNVALVSSGTVALEIALRALNLKTGDKVIVPDISFLATATAVANCGLIPVYADINPNDFCVSVDSIKAAYAQTQAKAIIVVHFAGFVARDINKLCQFCHEEGVVLIEDCAQAFACTYKGQHVGTIGDIGVFSLQSSKLIACGEGGIILAKRQEIISRCEAISNWGLTSQCVPREVNIPSSNFRLSAVQCYFAKKQLEQIDIIVDEQLQKINNAIAYAHHKRIPICIPSHTSDYFDCPFYIPIRSQLHFNSLEPRGEYPMYKSRIVTSILEHFYPNLANEYVNLNRMYKNERRSIQVIKYTDFLNIHNLGDNLCEELKKYIIHE